MSAQTKHTPEVAELVRLRDFYRRRAAICARLGMADASKDWSDAAQRITAEIETACRDSSKRLTPLIYRPRRAAIAKAVTP